MLRTLRVKNLAVVEDITVEFDEGLNVLTGETGAGKSIVVGALGLVLGERADRSLIRAGAQTSTVEAVFELEDSSAVDAVLDELGIDRCEDRRLIVRRILSASEANRNVVNDRSTTISALKRVGDLLVDMHGPHDHQSLLNRDYQLDLLDSFGDLADERSAYATLHRDLLDVESQRRELDREDDESVARQVDVLSFQVKEIEEAGIGAEEEDALVREHTRAANAARILELAGSAVQALTDGEDCAFDLLTKVQTALSRLKELLPEAESWRHEAESTAIQVQELAKTIGGAVGDVDADPQRLLWLDDRLALLRQLKRKYGPSVADVQAFKERARERLRSLEGRAERIREFDQRIEEQRKRLEAAGRRLSRKRSSVAGSLAERIMREIHDLGFAQSRFEIQIRTGDPRPSGLDEVEFCFAPNVGEPMYPLRAIASSGETSRVMLAIKAVLAAHDRVPVLVFDEIDANVGGETGRVVGARLRTVAAKRQVLCITHLPQVAAHGRRHFVVTKRVAGGRTRTDVREVEGEERAEEVARMLGGRNSTSVTLHHAREMLEKARGR